MLGMNRPVPSERMNCTAQTYTKPDGICGITNADLFLKSRTKVHQRNSAVEHHINGFAKTRLGRGLMCSGHVKWS